MTAPAALPNWPRRMRANLAAAYVGESETTFLADVGTIWPEPKQTPGRRSKRWDRLELDAAVDALDGDETGAEADLFTKALAHG